MGKRENMKKYFILSGLDLNDNNRGTAALGYGAFSFLQEKGFLRDNQELLQIHYTRNPIHQTSKAETLNIQGKEWKIRHLIIWGGYRRLFRKYGIVIPFSSYARMVKNIDFVAALNGGDGFSDIYNTDTFMARLPETLWAMKLKIPVIQLPQTMGPFKDPNNLDLAVTILRYSKNVYVRDKKFVEELDKFGIRYDLTKDLSAYMQPEPWDIDIEPNSIGINVSGLCYSNTFRSLSGQFKEYPSLINRLIEHFQKKEIHVYLIPHSYHYGDPEESNDDMVACQEAYNRLKNKKNVTLVNQDLISPQVKYIISKMSFFIGTRMHANFAAMYTHVPVFGLAYSSKFAGAFNANGLNADEQVAMINNINGDEIEQILDKIDAFYIKSRKI